MREGGPGPLREDVERGPRERGSGAAPAAAEHDREASGAAGPHQGGDGRLRFRRSAHPQEMNPVAKVASKRRVVSIGGLCGMVRKLLLVFAIALGLLGVTSAASAEGEVKLGTLAPADSAWGKVFKAWAKAVDEESS